MTQVSLLSRTNSFHESFLKMLLPKVSRLLLLKRISSTASRVRRSILSMTLRTILSSPLTTRMREIQNVYATVHSIVVSQINEKRSLLLSLRLRPALLTVDCKSALEDVLNR